METSLIEMLEFGHTTTFAIKFESRNEILGLRDRNYDVITFISKYLYYYKEASKLQYRILKNVLKYNFLNRN